ncbi:MAG TPA: hypothetical protein VG407_03205 [Caulobacteraceae bacterium]|jgi:hypothetical protein|nr:hypothetical protein [Caulobacteraceae bacterium]
MNLPLATAIVTLSLFGMASSVDPRPGGSDREVVGHSVISSNDPRATLTLPARFRYLGEDRWLLGGFDDAELHLFVDADNTGTVQRLFWVQFEAYVPDRPDLHHTYDSPRHATIGGLDFYVDTGVRAPDAAVEAGSDREHLEAMLRAHGLKPTPAMMYVRFVHLPDADRRKEMMVIYAEALQPGGPSPADLSPGGSHASDWPAMADALAKRGEAQMVLR